MFEASQPAVGNSLTNQQTNKGWAIVPGQRVRRASTKFCTQHYVHKRSVVVRVCNSSVVGLEAGVQDHPGLHSKFEACLRCMGSCLKAGRQRIVTTGRV